MKENFTTGRGPHQGSALQRHGPGNLRVAMKIIDIADLKNRLSAYMSLVEKGEEIEIRKRNAPIPRVVPLRRKVSTPSKLGAGAGTARIRGNLTEPLIPPEAWDMLGSS
jgi:prevent-host-death family protein